MFTHKHVQKFINKANRHRTPSQHTPGNYSKPTRYERCDEKNCGESGRRGQLKWRRLSFEEWYDKTLHSSFTYCLSPPRHRHSRSMCPANHPRQRRQNSSLSLSILYLWIFFFFFPLSYSRFLMQPCDYVKCCLSGLFVCLIAAECCVSRSSACILKQSQCGIIRHLTTLGADRPSSTATGNCSQLAWLSSNQRTWGALYKHTQTNTPILTQINDLKLT